MSPKAEVIEIQVLCTDCHYSQVVEKEGEKPAKKIANHGRKTGHKLTIEEIATDR